MRKLSPRSTNQDRLSQLRDQGEDSSVLLARLALIESEGLRKDLAKMATRDWCRPEVLPTQASLRWSTKNPNLGGFDREFWRVHKRVIHPSPGEWWLEWDWQGIEARMFIAYSSDQEDLDWLQPSQDIHTNTCQQYLFEWDRLPDDWQGSKDERRTRAKNFRYGVVQYGHSAKAVLQMPGIESLGLDRPTLIQRAETFLRARPKAQAFKQQAWAGFVRDGYARTFLGHRRWLFGDPATRSKEGMAHLISGSVAGMMDWCLIKICHPTLGAFPAGSVILNKHDGAIVSFPNQYDQAEVTTTVKAIVEREWEIGEGVPPMSFPAEWEVWE